jgi:hypothetical protein
VDAVVRAQDVRSMHVNDSSESSLTTGQRRAEVYQQNSPACSQADSQDSFPQNPQAGVQPPRESVETRAVPQSVAAEVPLRPPIAQPLPGDFLLAEYESDCARFVAEAKNLARRRTSQALFAH